MSALSSVEVIERYCEELWNEHDISAIRRWSHPDGVLHDYPGKSQLMGAAELEARLERVFQLLPDHSLEIHDLWSDGSEDVAWRWTVRGTWQGPWKTGTRIQFAGITWYRIVDGLIVRRYGVSEADKFDAQIGKTKLFFNLYVP